MKLLLRNLVACLLLPLVVPYATGQGTLHFANDENTLVRWSIPPDTEGAVPSESGLVQLLWAPEGAPLLSLWDVPRLSPREWLRQNPAWSFAGSPVLIGPEPGRYDGGIVTVPTAPGETVQVFLAGWGQAPDLQTAWERNLPLGVVAVNAFTTGSTPGSAPTVGSVTLWLEIHVPEPSPVAIFALGAAAFLVHSRWKRSSHQVSHCLPD